MRPSLYCSPRDVPHSRPPRAPAAAAWLARAARQRPSLPERVPRPLAPAPHPRLQRDATAGAAVTAPPAERRRPGDARARARLRGERGPQARDRRLAARRAVVPRPAAALRAAGLLGHVDRDDPRSREGPAAEPL